MSEIRRFKDIPEFKRESLEGEIITVNDVLDKEIIIYNFISQESFIFDSDFAIVQMAYPEKPDEKFTFTCGGGLILKYLKMAREKNRFPFITTIKKQTGKSGNEYYILE